MAVVNERVNASKAPTPTTGDSKIVGARSSSPSISANVTPSLGGSDDPGFFGSFFSKKKKPGVLENASV